MQYRYYRRRNITLAISVEVLEKSLKNDKELGSIYLFYGEETFLLDNALKKIKSNFGDLIKGINYIQVDETNLEQLVADIETPAFGYEKKLIVVRNTELFKREVKKKGSKFVEIRDIIADYIKNNFVTIREAVVLVFIEQSVDKAKMLSAVESVDSVVCNFERQKPNQLIIRLKSICNAYRVNVDESTLKYFIESCGTDLQNLINEIRKQIEYVGENGTITKQTINLLAIKQIESVIFDLTDNLGKKDVKKSLEVLNNLLYSKEPIQKILITLYNHFKKLYITKLVKKQNRNLAEVLNLKPNQMFLTTKYKMQSDYFEQNELKNILQQLINLDRKYKSGLIDINVGLEAIIAKF